MGPRSALPRRGRTPRSTTALQEDATEQVPDPEEDQDHDRNDQRDETDHGQEAGLAVAVVVTAARRVCGRRVTSRSATRYSEPVASTTARACRPARAPRRESARGSGITQNAARRAGARVTEASAAATRARIVAAREDDRIATRDQRGKHSRGVLVIAGPIRPRRDGRRPATSGGQGLDQRSHPVRVVRSVEQRERIMVRRPGAGPEPGCRRRRGHSRLSSRPRNASAAARASAKLRR